MTFTILLLGALVAMIVCATEHIFMNFATIDSEFAVPTTTVLVERTLSTGMTPFSDRPWGWVVHKIEIEIANISQVDASNNILMALSTRQGLAAMPMLTDVGTIWKGGYMATLDTNGKAGSPLPMTTEYLPGILFATPEISLYLATAVQNTDLDGTPVGIRIGFLTVPMTQQRWNEVNQTWSLAE